jgi:hypothetical protein
MDIRGEILISVRTRNWNRARFMIVGYWYLNELSLEQRDKYSSL